MVSTRLSARVDRLAQQLPKRPRPANVLTLQRAWCKRHGVDATEALQHMRQGGQVLILRASETDADALADWPGPPVVVLPPMVEP